MIRVKIPGHLQSMVGAPAEIQLEFEGPVTPRAILDSLEERYPGLRGTIRDAATGQRRAYLRFFACKEDLSHEPMDAPLPEAIGTGQEPFWIIGAIAGG